MPFCELSGSGELGDDLVVQNSNLSGRNRGFYQTTGVSTNATLTNNDVSGSQAVAVQFERELAPAEARVLLAAAPGVEVVDEPELQRYPMPLPMALISSATWSAPTGSASASGGASTERPSSERAPNSSCDSTGEW